MPVSDTFLQDMEDENKFIQERHSIEYELRRLRQIEKRYKYLVEHASSFTYERIGSPDVKCWQMTIVVDSIHDSIDSAVDSLIG